MGTVTLGVGQLLSNKQNSGGIKGEAPVPCLLCRDKCGEQEERTGWTATLQLVQHGLADSSQGVRVWAVLCSPVSAAREGGGVGLRTCRHSGIPHTSVCLLPVALALFSQAVEMRGALSG